MESIDGVTIYDRKVHTEYCNWNDFQSSIFDSILICSCFEMYVRLECCAYLSVVNELCACLVELMCK